MPTLGSITKTVRINADDLAVFEDIMCRENLSWSGAVHYLVSNMGVPQKQGKQDVCVPQNNKKSVPLGVPITENCGSIPKDLYDHIMSMVDTYGMSYEEFMKIIDVFLDKCYIQDDGGTLKTIDSKLDTSGFIAKCEEYGIKDYQTVFDRMVKQMKAN